MLLALALVGCGAARSSDDPENVGVARSAVVGAATSATQEDFALFLTHLEEDLYICGATLVAPNLILTAKHCVYQYAVGEGECGADGNPAPASPGGYVTGDVPLSEIALFSGVDARKRYLDQGGLPTAFAKKIIDDGSIKLCSFDLAYVVLDRPIKDAPIARMRLGKRPAEGAKIAVAGWGAIENRIFPKFRQSRGDITIRRVGEPELVVGATGVIAPRTFESTGGGCKGDSGGPGFDPATGAILGVMTRALGLDEADPVSPCMPESVSVVYAIPTDFPDQLRAAFAEAKAEPWLEGRAAPGYLRFDEVCSADLECASSKCLGATKTTTGRCNLDCTKAACPATHRCGEGGTCEPLAVSSSSSGSSSSGASSGESSSGAPTNPEVEPEESRLSSCTSASARGLAEPGWPLAALVASSLCIVVQRRRRRGACR